MRAFSIARIKAFVIMDPSIHWRHDPRDQSARLMRRIKGVAWEESR
jgi:hypothetical protein